MILVGDPHQLPPLVHSKKRRRDLQLSLMERLIEQGYPCDVLNVQHRSHKMIASWSSQRFYNSGLYSAGRVAQQTLARDQNVADNPFTRAPMVLVSVNGGSEVHLSCGGSLFNHAEISAVAAIVNRLVTMGVNPEDIGVISPYQSQVDLISKRLGEVGGLTIKTVDSFQGSERGVIGGGVASHCLPYLLLYIIFETYIFIYITLLPVLNSD